MKEKLNRAQRCARKFNRAVIIKCGEGTTIDKMNRKNGHITQGRTNVAVKKP